MLLEEVRCLITNRIDWMNQLPCALAPRFFSAPKNCHFQMGDVAKPVSREKTYDHCPLVALAPKLLGSDWITLSLDDMFGGQIR